MFSVFESFCSELLSSARKGRQEIEKSGVFTLRRDSCTTVARARAVRMSPGATPEAQGARHSGRAEPEGRTAWTERATSDEIPGVCGLRCGKRA